MMNEKELMTHLAPEAVAARISAGSIHLLCDIDAIKHGEEKFLTSHFGYIDDEFHEMVQVHTDSRDRSWMIKITASDLEYQSEFTFKVGIFNQVIEDGERVFYDVRFDVEAPQAFTELVETSMNAGLKDTVFVKTPELVPTI